MKLHLLTILGLSLSLLFAGCDDDDTTTETSAGETAGAVAGTDAGTEAGEEAGTDAGTEAGEEAGTEAGEEAGTEAGEVAGEEVAPGTIVEVAIDNGSFTTLVAAVEAAGLVDLLSGEDEYTVLAPTDDAFAALPEGTVETLVEDANNGGDQLAKILQLHVVAGSVLSSALSDGDVVPTANGDLTVNISEEGTVTFTNGNTTATVVIADVEASNGVIHAIDTVLLPATEAEPSEKNIVEVATDDGRFNTLVAAVDAAGLVDFLSGEGPFTVLAPTDDAFAALPEGTVDMLVMDAQMGGTQLADILSLHVIADEVTSDELVDGQEVPTANGTLTVSVSAEGVTFSNEGSSANVVVADVDASNGVVHAIDAVLMP